jgi:hypothetical protein
VTDFGHNLEISGPNPLWYGYSKTKKEGGVHATVDLERAFAKVKAHVPAIAPHTKTKKDYIFSIDKQILLAIRDS